VNGSTVGVAAVQARMRAWLTEASQGGSGDDITLGILCRDDISSSIARDADLPTATRAHDDGARPVKRAAPTSASPRLSADTMMELSTFAFSAPLGQWDLFSRLFPGDAFPDCTVTKETMRGDNDFRVSCTSREANGAPPQSGWV